MWSLTWQNASKEWFLLKKWYNSLKGYNSTQTQPPSLPQLPITLGQEKSCHPSCTWLSSAFVGSANHWLLIHISHMGRLHGKHLTLKFLIWIPLSSVQLLKPWSASCEWSDFCTSLIQLKPRSLMTLFWIAAAISAFPASQTTAAMVRIKRELELKPTARQFSLSWE